MILNLPGYNAEDPENGSDDFEVLNITRTIAAQHEEAVRKQREEQEEQRQLQETAAYQKSMKEMMQFSGNKPDATPMRGRRPLPPFYKHLRLVVSGLLIGNLTADDIHEPISRILIFSHLETQYFKITFCLV